MMRVFKRAVVLSCIFVLPTLVGCSKGKEPAKQGAEVAAQAAEPKPEPKPAKPQLAAEQGAQKDETRGVVVSFEGEIAKINHEQFTRAVAAGDKVERIAVPAGTSDFHVPDKVNMGLLLKKDNKLKITFTADPKKEPKYTISTLQPLDANEELKLAK